MAVENSATGSHVSIICLRGMFQADYLSTVNLKLGSLFILTVASFPNYTTNPQQRKVSPHQAGNSVHLVVIVMT